MSVQTGRVPRWGLVDVVAGLLGFVLLSALVQALVRMPALATQPQLRWALEQIVAGWLPLVAVVLIACFWRGRRSLAADFGLRFQPVDLAIGLLAGLVLRASAVGIAELTRAVSGTPSTPYGGGVGADPLWFALTAVVAASIVTPVVEELYFRGLVLRSLQQAVLGTGTGTEERAPDRHRLAAVVAVIGSSLLFVVFHLDGVPETAAAVSRLITLFIVGLVLGCLAVLTRRLGPSIVTHMVFNLSVAVIDIVTSATSAPSAPILG
ncbi:CPBP family intramembrane metalloprotease [Herbiconiux sp. CPCC 203407]|uniref:CPBP family intramembrane metalloprotease n=1 Tax=Herbiconiux oxytropis TaxID=2970915 RepID=A0AA42BTU3_9MICO|nr:type II CAAX endopeptidase family protein [Herbiconiux oxytropis]MCS5723972.1 CPBP family intramembrane metalloprotease [Herbiconiux oxytropis]MCS5726815.1 CPBP family intramembrane metalloprotease [Herbiconiux oxytropis]